MAERVQSEQYPEPGHVRRGEKGEQRSIQETRRPRGQEGEGYKNETRTGIAK